MPATEKCCVQGCAGQCTYVGGGSLDPALCSGVKQPPVPPPTWTFKPTDEFNPVNAYLQIGGTLLLGPFFKIGEVTTKTYINQFYSGSMDSPQDDLFNYVTDWTSQFVQQEVNEAILQTFNNSINGLEYQLREAAAYPLGSKNQRSAMSAALASSKQLAPKFMNPSNTWQEASLFPNWVPLDLVFRSYNMGAFPLTKFTTLKLMLGAIKSYVKQAKVFFKQVVTNRLSTISLEFGTATSVNVPDCAGRGISGTSTKQQYIASDTWTACNWKFTSPMQSYTNSAYMCTGYTMCKLCTYKSTDVPNGNCPLWKTNVDTAVKNHKDAVKAKWVQFFSVLFLENAKSWEEYGLRIAKETCPLGLQKNAKTVEVNNYNAICNNLENAEEAMAKQQAGEEAAVAKAKANVSPLI
jgi:hypothetical protein